MLLLASASPRRADLLTAAGILFEVFAPHIDESRLPHESADAYVRRLAENKARAALGRQPGAVVLGADTVVVVEGRMLGKPTDAAEAATMLRSLAGRAHEVLTGVALLTQSTAAIEAERTRVWFSPLSDDDIDWYVRSGEPMDKAGAYAIQGLGSRFIERIDGSYANVVGLPVALVYRLLQNVPEIRRSSRL